MKSNRSYAVLEAEIKFLRSELEARTIQRDEAHQERDDARRELREHIETPIAVAVAMNREVLYHGDLAGVAESKARESLRNGTHAVAVVIENGAVLPPWTTAANGGVARRAS
jgi:hypothetical protein